MLNHYLVKEIPKEDVLDLRSIVLRNGLSPSECVFPRDELPSTFHLGGFVNGKLICIGSFYEEANMAFDAQKPFHLRGMATLPEYRGQNAGTLLISEAEKIIKERGGDLWWCNARVTAIDFYVRLGLKTIGDIFNIEGVGPHKLMFQKL
ncbi:MAG: GNAT family N-acetyltransferase [Clostridiales bacterium]|nr:GNAT family N-acetyltransferase [Clostridiales bacterium]